MKNANKVFNDLIETLKTNGIDYEKIIDDFGQVNAFIDRQNGRCFSLKDHVRGLILAQLSNQRPWRPIADNMFCLEEIFLGFDPESLKSADPKSIEEQVKSIKCGNRQISKQCTHLSTNIETLEKLADEYGEIDSFITSQPPEVIAKALSQPGQSKIKQMGFTLAMEYLRNVGINVIKPDLHICRIIGPERLGIVDFLPSPEQGYDALMEWSRELHKPAIWIDNLLWLFAAQDYAAICTASPRCSVCKIVDCNQYARHN